MPAELGNRKEMKGILSILGPLLTGSIGLAVFAPNAVDAGMKFN
jgi:hypothetical protein